jgi:hypothetical protein
VGAYAPTRRLSATLGGEIMKRLICISLLFLSCSGPGNTVIDKKYELIEELFKATNMYELIKSTTNAMNETIYQQLKESNPQLNNNLTDSILVIIKQTTEGHINSKDPFIRAIMGVYEKTFTLNELKQLINFNKSDIGKKFNRESIKMNEEAMQIGREYWKIIQAEVYDKIESKFKEHSIKFPNQI